MSDSGRCHKQNREPQFTACNLPLACSGFQTRFRAGISVLAGPVALRVYLFVAAGRVSTRPSGSFAMTPPTIRLELSHRRAATGGPLSRHGRQYDQTSTPNGQCCATSCCNIPSVHPHQRRHKETGYYMYQHTAGIEPMCEQRN